MATIEIGGRQLEVKDCSIGFWERLQQFRENASKAGDREAINAVVGFFHELTDHNEGVTVQWLKDHLPINPARLNELLDKLLIAGGMLEPAAKDAPAGEAPAR